MTGPQIGLAAVGGVAVAAVVAVGVVATRPHSPTAKSSTSQTTSQTTTSSSSSTSSATLVAPPLPDPSCQQEPSLKSIAGTTRFDLTFINNTTETLQALWLNYQGKRVFYRQIPAGTRYTQPSWITHPWVVADLAGTCLTLYTIDGRQASVSVPVGSVGPPQPQASPLAGPALGNAAVLIQATDNTVFNPQTVDVRVGDIVEWDNGGTIGHNVTFDDANLASSNDLTLNAGDKWQVKLTTAGTFTYQCTIHAGMTGTITVH